MASSRSPKSSGEKGAPEASSSPVVPCEDDHGLFPPRQTLPVKDCPVPNKIRRNAEFLGFVAQKNTRNPTFTWVRISCPLHGIDFYSKDKSHFYLPVGAPVSFSQGQAVARDGTWFCGATNVRPLTPDQLQRRNRSDKPQLWYRGTIVQFHNQTYTYTIELSRDGLSPLRVSYSSDALAPGSHILPVGSPVHFQTAYVSTPQGERSIVRVMAVRYDDGRINAHVGRTPNGNMLSQVQRLYGECTLWIGPTESSSILAVDPADLTNVISKVDNMSLLDLVSAGKEVLRERLARADSYEAPTTPPPDHTSFLRDCLARLDSEEESITVYCTPGLFTRKAIVRMVNNYYHRHAGDTTFIKKVVILEPGLPGLNKDNIHREAGLLYRAVEEWRAKDHQSRHGIFHGLGCFEVLAPPSLGDPDYWSLVEDPSSEGLPLVTTVMEQVGHEGLILPVTERVGDPEGEDPSSLKQDPLLEADTSPKPAILVSYAKSRRAQAEHILGTVKEAHDPFIIHAPHPDGRRTQLIATFSAGDDKIVASLISELNEVTLDKLFHAGSYADLYQDKDDTKVRTLVCKSGYLPPLDLLLDIDPLIQVRAIKHGIVRLSSSFTTNRLIAALRTQNEAIRGSHRDGGHYRASLAPFQVILDGEGYHWITEPASPPPPKSTFRGWGSFSPPRQATRAGVHRWLVQGPTPMWKDDAIRKLLAMLRIPEGLADEATWVRAEGYDGHRLQLLSKVEEDVNSCQILFAELIYASVDKAPKGLKIAAGRSVFKRRPCKHTDIAQVKAAIAAAVANQDLGKHDVGPSEAEVIAKVRAAKAAEAAKSMPSPAAVAILARKQASSTGPSQPSTPNPTPRAATSTAAPRAVPGTMTAYFTGTAKPAKDWTKVPSKARGLSPRNLTAQAQPRRTPEPPPAATPCSRTTGLRT